MYGIVYRIRSPSLGKDYYGSSTEGKEKRWAGHLISYRRWKKGDYEYITSFELIEAGDAFMKVLEEKKDWKDKDELRWRERWYFDNFECVNVCKPICSKEEYKEREKAYYEANKEKLSEYYKVKYQANKEEINKRNKDWREANKSKIAEKARIYRKATKEKRRERWEIYYKENKERIKAYQEANKDKILAKRKERILCDICGKNIYRAEISRHKRTMKCRAILLNPFSNAFNFF